MAMIGALLGWSICVIVWLFVRGTLIFKDGWITRDREDLRIGTLLIVTALVIATVDAFAVWLAVQ